MPNRVTAPSTVANVEIPSRRGRPRGGSSLEEGIVQTVSSTTPSYTDGPWRAFDATEFRGRVALVTGAASGMGRATARAFVDRGASVVLADIDESALKRVETELLDLIRSDEAEADDRAASPEASPESAARDAGTAPAPDPARGVLAVRTDVADAESVTRLYERLDDLHGRLDHVVHAAAVLSATPFLQGSAEHWRRVLDVNLIGTVNVLRPALARMLDQRSGTVVAVASDAGHRGAGHEIADAAYAASKAGVLSVVKSLAREFAGQGVRINALAPGASDTPLLSGLSDSSRAQIESLTPLGRLGRPEEIAAAILFLSSRAAEFVYGASLDVDGGSMFR